MTKTKTLPHADREVIVADTAVEEEEDDCAEECCPICYESYTQVWRLPSLLSSDDGVALDHDRLRLGSTRHVEDGDDTSTVLDDNDEDDGVNTDRNNSTTTSRTVSPSSSSSSFDENCMVVAMKSDQQRTIDLDLEIGEGRKNQKLCSNINNEDDNPWVDDSTAPLSRRRRQHPHEKVRIPGCQHTFCRDCLHNHCVYTIGLHKVPIRCPALGCSSILPVTLIRDSLGVPDHDEHDPGNTDDDNDDNDHGEEEQEQTQNQTEHSHGNNSNDSTNQYWIQFQRLHQMYLDNNTNLFHQQHQHHADTPPPTGGQRARDRDAKVKPCSHCGVPIYKDAGCDHIVCPRCDHDMCFKCGTHVYLTGRLGTDQASMIRECVHCQQSFVDHRHRRAYRCLLILLLPVCLPICIIYASMAALLAVGTGGCFCCLGCGIRIQPRRPRSTMVKKKKKKKKKKKRPNTVLSANNNNNNNNHNDEKNSNNSNSNTINCSYVRKGTAPSSSSVTRNNNDNNNNSIHSTTGTTTTRRTTRTKRNTRSVRWMPMVAIQRVLGFIFLPFLDLFFQLGITDKCCPGSNCGEFTKHVSLKYLFCFWKDDDKDENESGCEDEDCDYEYTGDDDEYECTDDDEETH